MEKISNETLTSTHSFRGGWMSSAIINNTSIKNLIKKAITLSKKHIFLDINTVSLLESILQN